MALIHELIPKIAEEAGVLEKAAAGGVPFPFRGIDNTINHLSPTLNKYGVFAAPNVIRSETEAREVGNRVIKTTDIDVKFTFYAPDGSSIDVTTTGLADDFADRSAAQAQSVAYRVALLQLFHLPTQSPEPEQSGQAVVDALDKDAKIPAAPKVAPAKDSITAVKAEVKAFIDKGEYTSEQVNAIGDRIAGTDGNTRNWTLSDYKKILAAVKAGEVA